MHQIRLQQRTIVDLRCGWIAFISRQREWEHAMLVAYGPSLVLEQCVDEAEKMSGEQNHRREYVLKYQSLED